MPWEPILLKREAEGGTAELTREEMRSLQEKARISGLWGIDTPEDYGGADMSQIMRTLATIELGRTVVLFHFGGTGDGTAGQTSLSLLNDEQKTRFLPEL